MRWISAITDDKIKHDRLCELNVIEQVLNVCNTTIVQDAWERKQKLSIHGWIYAIDDGVLRDLDVCVDNIKEIKTAYTNAVDRRR